MKLFGDLELDQHSGHGLVQYVSKLIPQTISVAHTWGNITIVWVHFRKIYISRQYTIGREYHFEYICCSLIAQYLFTWWFLQMFDSIMYCLMACAYHCGDTFRQSLECWFDIEYQNNTAIKSAWTTWHSNPLNILHLSTQVSFGNFPARDLNDVVKLPLCCW